jgi:hypothetical protein
VSLLILLIAQGLLSNNNQFANDINQDTNSSNKQDKPNEDDFEDDIPF